MSIIEILQSKPDAELAIAVQEVVSWRKTGVLEGNVLRTITYECGAGFDLRNVESELLLLAASRWADTALKKGQSVAWIENHDSGISFDMYSEIASKLPKDTRFELYPVAHTDGAA